MKFIYMMVLLSSMLFAMQKQIILGSYSVESNAANALNIVKEQIRNDEKLKNVLDVKSVKLENGLISGYSVVSVNAFDSYADLLPVIQIFKTYYDDAFVIKYPTENFLVKEDINTVEIKAKTEILEEDMTEDEILAQEKLASQEIIEEEVIVAAEEVVEKVLVQEKAAQDDIEKLEELIEEVKEIKEPEPTPSVQSLDDVMADVERRHNEKSSSIGDYVLGVLVVLAILLAGYLIYRRISGRAER